MLSELGIRTWAKAKYTAVNVGHYGLGFEYYCHFTSPIRRYPDIMVHRILLEVLEDRVAIDKKWKKNVNIAAIWNVRQWEAERDANKYKQVQYMQQFIGDEFDAIINSVFKGLGFGQKHWTIFAKEW